DAAAFSLGPAYATGLALFFRDCACEYLYCGGSNGASAKVARNPNEEGRRKSEYRKPKERSMVGQLSSFTFGHCFGIRHLLIVIRAMAITVPRPRLNWRERLYLPAIVAGLAITFKHFKNMVLGRTKVTMQYTEQKWDSSLPDHY